MPKTKVQERALDGARRRMKARRKLKQRRDDAIKAANAAAQEVMAQGAPAGPGLLSRTFTGTVGLLGSAVNVAVMPVVAVSSGVASGWNKVTSLFKSAEVPATSPQQGVRKARARTKNKELELARAMKRMAQMEGEMKRLRAELKQKQGMPQTPAHVIAAPPPPPPPAASMPPPPPPPPMMGSAGIVLRKRLPTAAEEVKPTSAPKMKLEKKGSAVNLDDILSVRLRSAPREVRTRTVPETPAKFGVTLADIHGARLRMSTRKQLGPVENTIEGTPMPAHKLRAHIERSPGGTPLRPRHAHHAEQPGHQAIVNSALRRKFKNVATRSPGSPSQTPSFAMSLRSAGSPRMSSPSMMR